MVVIVSSVLVLYLCPLLLDAPLTDPDEGLHAAISQEMVERGDLVVPRFLGRAFLDKPILFFWAQAASIRVFGMNTAAARLPGILFALLGVATTAWLARVLLGSRQWAVGSGQRAVGTGHESAIGWIAAACYATMVLPFLLAQAPVHDIALVPFTNLALLFLWRARWGSGFGIWDLGFAGVALGLSILTKGLEGVAFVGIGYGLYLVVTRAVSWRLASQGALVLTIAVLLALPWYLTMNAREPGYLRYYFVDRHLLAFATDTQRHNGQPWWFYLPVVIGGGLPWILFIGWARPPKPLAKAEGAPCTVLWTWLAGTIALLSVSSSKAVTYVLPAMPAIAILAAASLPTVRVWRRLSFAAAVFYSVVLVAFGPSVARAHSARDLAAYFNGLRAVPSTVFVFDQRVSFVYYLRPELRRQLRPDGARSVSVEELEAMQPFPRNAVVTLPEDLAATRLPRIPQLANARRDVAGRYLVVTQAPAHSSVDQRP